MKTSHFNLAARDHWLWKIQRQGQPKNTIRTNIRIHMHTYALKIIKILKIN